MKTLDQKIHTQAHAELEGRPQRRFFRSLPFLGPAMIAAVAYIDPGNFATNIQGGAEYGYMLLWVILWANLMAMLIQSLSAKLGIATGKNLPEMIREHYPRPVVWFYWIQAEIIAMATELAEFLGAALGFYLLFDIPLIWAAGLTAVVTFAILSFERFGFRMLEAVIAALVLAVALGYVVEIFLAKPDPISITKGLLIPQLSDTNSLYLAAGILGATVMPHVIYLHSALTQNRIPVDSEEKKYALYRYTLKDVVIGMIFAGFVNMAMLIMAAATFYETGHQDVASIETAYQTLTPLLGDMASTVFAITLLISGIASSVVGAMSGQVVMQGFVNFSIPMWLRRVITMTPALVVIMLGMDPTAVLVASQVVLSFGIALALIPLLQFTNNKKYVGSLVNHPLTIKAGTVIVTVILALNAFLLWQTLTADSFSVSH